MTPKDPAPLSSVELEAAIARDELVLFYQPQWLADGATIVSFEALARWDHPAHGLLPPTDFIAVAEENGLLPLVTERLLARACREAGAWAVPVAINVSPSEFANASFVATIRATLDRLSFPPDRLELEIVESAMFDDLASAERILDELRALGIKIALDDFGTGYSSLSLLRRLPFDKVKIDKSFIDDITTMRSAGIVHAVIALARALGLKVTAEGVETAEQHRFLKIAGCHYLQGYLFSRPLLPAQVETLLVSTPSVPRAVSA